MNTPVGVTTTAVFGPHGVFGEQEEGPGPALRCASLLKLIFAWVTPLEGWESLAPPMITRSDNDATDRLVHTGGGLTPLADRITRHTGVELAPAPTWGRFEVTAAQVAALYASLQAAAASGEPQAAAVLELMARLRAVQRFGADTAWAEASGRPVTGIKTGWDLDHDQDLLRTHVVVLGARFGAVVLTGVTVTPGLRVSWERGLRTHGPEGVLELHAAAAGDRVVTSLRASAQRADEGRSRLAETGAAQ